MFAADTNRCFRHPRSRLFTVAAVMLTACLLIAGSPSDIAAQAKVGTTGAQFLEVGVSARAMGMAEAFTAVANDVSAVYYNPAGLTSLYGREGMATYIQMPADVQYGAIAYGMPLESIGGVLGFSAYALTSGDMDETTYLNSARPGGVIGTGRTFSYNDLAIAMSYGRYLTDKFSIGFTVRYIGEFTHDYSSNGWSADVGVTYDTGYRGFKLAMAITNFGPDLQFIDKDYPLPINFKFGGSINVLESFDHTVMLAAEGAHPADNLEKYNAGVEYLFKERFALRVGSRFNYDSDGITAGGGLRIPYGDESELRFDYAYQDFGLLTEVHRFTLALAF